MARGALVCVTQAVCSPATLAQKQSKEEGCWFTVISAYYNHSSIVGQTMSCMQLRFRSPAAQSLRLLTYHNITYTRVKCQQGMPVSEL